MNYKYALGIVALAAFLFGCSSGGVTAPTSSKPTVQIQTPANNETFTQGETVGIQSVSADPNGVLSVELYVDGQLVKIDRTVTGQGETQFNVIQQWVANSAGAHTILVRAYNAANASGESAVSISVNESAAALPTATDVPEPEATATEPDATATETETDEVEPGVTVETLAVAPTRTPTPTIPTPLPPSPIPPTIPPLIFLLPFDGGANLSVDWNGAEMQMEATANDVEAGNDDGDGIAYIEFFIQDLAGNVIASKRENNKPYCFFGEEDGQCTLGRPGEPNFQWGPGVPIENGWYFIRAVSHTPDNRIQVVERSLFVTLDDTPFPNLFAVITQPENFNLENELTIEAQAEGESADSGIDHIDFFVVTYDGKIVHTRTERTALYCGFGGGENGQPCNTFVFSQNGGKWPNGSSVNPTQYIVRAVAYANDGSVSADSRFFQIDRVQ